MALNEKAHMRKNTLIGIGMVAVSLALLLGVLYFSRGAIREMINDYRGDRLYGQAVEAFDAGDWEEAARKGTAAFYLKGGDPEVELLVARSLLKQRDIASVAWWTRALERAQLPVDELRELTSLLINSRMYEEALPFLERLVELDSNEPETQVLWLQTLNAQRKLSQTRALAEALVQSGSEDWQVHEQYLRAQLAAEGGEDNQGAVEHLRGLISGEGPLAVLAARELLLLPSLEMADYRMAADYLEGETDDPLDKLLLKGIRVRIGDAEPDEMGPALDAFLESDKEDRYEQALQWAFWMNTEDLYLDRVSWTQYRQGDGQAGLYFQALLNAGQYSRLRELSQSDYSETDPESTTFLVYRAAALEASGNPAEAETTLRHAVQVTDPEKFRPLERYLLQNQNWALLSELYNILVDEDPDNTALQMRRMAALYYTGDQEALADILPGMELEAFENTLGSVSFVAYLKLIALGPSPELHGTIEEYLTRYPEIYDFRLIAGLSYLLQGRTELAASFAENMPEIDITAPRYMRICAALLERNTEGRLRVEEWQRLLPRERLLLSRLAD